MNPWLFLKQGIQHLLFLDDHTQLRHFCLYLRDLVWGFCFRVLPAKMKGETWNKDPWPSYLLPRLCFWVTTRPSQPCTSQHVHILHGLLMHLSWPTSLSFDLSSPWVMALSVGLSWPSFSQWALQPPLHPAGPGSGSLPGCFQTCWCFQAVGTLLPAAPALLQLRCEHCYGPSRAATDSGPSATALQCLGLPGSTCQNNMNKRALIPFFPLQQKHTAHILPVSQEQMGC